MNNSQVTCNCATSPHASNTAANSTCCESQCQCQPPCECGEACNCGSAE